MTAPETEKKSDPVLDAILGRVAENDEESLYKKIVLWGEPGAGKTVLSASAPGPVWFYSTDTGYESIHNHPDLLSNTRRIPYGNFAFTKALSEKALSGDLPCKTLVLDTFTGIVDNSLKELAQAKFKKDPMRPAGPYVAEGKDYQENTEQFKFIIANLTMAPLHIVYICHREERKDESTGKIMMGPAGTPKIMEKLYADATLMGYMTESTDNEGTSTRRLQVSGGGDRIRVKNRIKGLPPVVENPTVDMLLDPTVYF